MADFPMFAVGFVAAFLSALLAVRTLVKFVANHTYEIFAWYRIAFGLVILATWHFGLVAWHV
jgi:undecaprenyl-diphosphatase